MKNQQSWESKINASSQHGTTNTSLKSCSDNDLTRNRPGRASGYDEPFAFHQFGHGNLDYEWSFDNPLPTFDDVIVSPSGSLVAIRNASTIWIFESASLTNRSKFDCPVGTDMVCFSEDGAYLAIQQGIATDAGDTAESSATKALQIVDSTNGDVVWHYNGTCQRPRFGGENDEFIAGIADSDSIVLIKWRK